MSGNRAVLAPTPAQNASLALGLVPPITVRPVAPPTPPSQTGTQIPPEVQAAAQKTGVRAPLIAAVMKVESRGNPAAVSPKGAIGQMQLMPGTAAGLGVDPNNPSQNIQGGAEYLAQMTARYGGDETKGLMAYNWGPNNVDKWIASGADPAAVPASVRSYVQQVKQAEGGDYSSQIQSTMAANNALFAQGQDAQAPIYEQMMQTMTQDRARFDKIADSYTPYQPPPPPAQPVNDPLKGFGSAAAIFASLASMFTHTPAIAAMNGLSAAINAAKKNDWDAYQDHYKRWEDATANMLAQHKLQASDMQQALDTMQTDLSTGLAMARVVAAKSGDQIAQNLANLGEYEKLYDLQQARNTAAQNTENNARHFQLDQPKILAAQALSNAQQGLAAAQATGDPAKIAKAQQSLTQAQQQYAFAMNPGGAAERPGTPSAQINAKYNEIISQNPNLSPADAWAQADDWYKNHAGKPPSGSAAKEQDVETLATAAFVAKYGRQPGPGDAATMASLREQQRVGAGGTISDDAAKLVADRVLDGDESATTGLARNQANMTKIANFMVEEAKRQGLSPEEINDRVAEFQGTRSAARTLGTRQANMEVAANEVKRMLPLALSASQAVSRSQYPDLNKIMLAARLGQGDENVVRFGLAANSLIYEYAKFLNPTGIPTDSDKAKATDILSTAWSQGQFQAAVGQIQKEIAVGRSAITDTRSELNSGLTTSTTPPTTSAATPVASPLSAPLSLPSVKGDDGMLVPDRTKLRDGQIYLLPGGQKARWAAATNSFVIAQ